MSLQLRKRYSLLNVGIQSLSHLRKEGHNISMLDSLDESRLAFSSIGPTAIGEKTKKIDLSEFITLRPVGHSDMKRAKSQNFNGCILFRGAQTCDPPITSSMYPKTNIYKMLWRCGAISSLVLTNHLQTSHPYRFFERRSFEPTLSMDFRWLIHVKKKKKTVEGLVSQSTNQPVS